MKKTIPILLTVLLAVSCSQVVYDNLPPEDIGGASTTVTATQQDTSRNILLTFEPVPYVAAYAYSFNDGTPIPFEADEYENGMLSYQIYASRVPSNKGTVNLFGRVSGSDKWVNLGFSQYSLEINESEIPDVYMYSRNETDVVLKVNPSDSSKTYLYKTVVMDEDNKVVSETKFAQASDNKITIPDLNSDEIYFVNVYQKDSLATEDPATYAAIEVPVFEHEVTLSLSTSETGFVISGIETGTQEIELKNTNNESLSVVKNVENINNGSVEISFSEVPSLESGLFYVYSTNGSVVSNNVKTTAPVSILSTTPNYRSVDLEIDFSSTVDVSSIDFSANDSTTTYSVNVVSVDPDNKTIISITDLKSKTPYEANKITLGVIDADVAVPEFTTKSFADKYYEWKGKFEGSNQDTNFVIYVKNVPEGSEYPYYVYFSTNDDVFKYEEVGGYKDIYGQTSYRIMPLVDTSEAIGEPITNSSHVVYFDNSKNPENLKKQNSAYVANSIKWNSLRDVMGPDTWFISDFKISIDKVITYTTSTALGGIVKVPTTTTFEFMEYRENGIALPVIKFKNVCSMGIEKNADTSGPQKYGDYDEKDGANCWYLTLTNFNEEGAE